MTDATTTAVPTFEDAGEVAARVRAATAAAFLAAETRDHDPYAVTMSRLGDCTRQLAYALSGTPTTDDPPREEKRAAWLGTWQHEGLLPLLAAQLPGAATEVKVTARVAGLDIRGRIDLDWPGVLTLDLKTVGEHRLSGVRRVNDPHYAHRLQVGVNALAKLQEGEPPEWVGWHYLDRASGDEHLIAQPFTNGLVLEVIDRVEKVQIHADEPDTAPREHRGPGLSFACDRCPWLRRCWGEDAVPGRTGPQAVHSDPEILSALVDYDEARQRAKAAKDDQAYAAARLERARHRTYGPVPGRPDLAVKLSRDRDGEALDQKAARELIQALGGEVPTQPKRGALRVRLVKMPPDDTPIG